jgi:hypothetical protein
MTGTFFTVLLILLIVRLVLSAQPGGVPRRVAGAEVYCISNKMRAVLLGSAAGYCALALTYWKEIAADPYAAVFVIVITGAVAVSVALSSGTIRLDEYGVTQSEPWRRRFLSWHDIKAVVHDSDKNYLTITGTRKQQITVDSRYVAIPTLAETIARKASISVEQVSDRRT